MFIIANKFAEIGSSPFSILVKTKSGWPFVGNPLLWVSYLGGINEVLNAKKIAAPYMKDNF